VEILGIEAVRRLKRMTRHHPGLGLRLAAGLGAALGPGSRWAPPDVEVAAVLGSQERRAIRRVQRRVAANTLRDVALGSIVNRGGLGAVTERVRVVGAERLLELRARGTPVVVLLAHVGVLHAAGFTLEKLAIPARMMKTGRMPRVVEHVQYTLVRDALSAVRFLRQALVDLSRGIVPLVAMDASFAAVPDLAVFGRPVHAGRGLARLARTGARLVPLTGRWIGSSALIETTVHPPLPEPRRDASDPAWESEVVDGCVRWLERYLRENPGEMWPWDSSSLAGVPRL